MISKSDGLTEDKNGARDKNAGNQEKQTERWRCPNCGQHVFVDARCEPPDICQYCKDLTTWERFDR